MKDFQTRWALARWDAETNAANDLFNERAGYVLASALETINIGGIAPLDDGFDAVFGAKKNRGLGGNRRARSIGPLVAVPKIHEPIGFQPVPVGKHVLGGRALPRQNVGLLWDRGQTLTAARFKHLLIEQSRQQEFGFVYLVSSLEWLPVLGFLGLTYQCMAASEGPQEFVSRVADRHELSAIIDGNSGVMLWHDKPDADQANQADQVEL